MLNSGQNESPPRRACLLSVVFGCVAFVRGLGLCPRSLWLLPRGICDQKEAEAGGVPCGRDLGWGGWTEAGCCGFGIKNPTGGMRRGLRGC